MIIHTDQASVIARYISKKQNCRLDLPRGAVWLRFYPPRSVTMTQYQ